MANLKLNQVYKKYVEHTGTPFHIWIDAEKKQFQKRKGVTDEEMKNKPEMFLRYMNNRYRAGGDELWTKNMDSVMNQPDEEVDNVNNESTVKKEETTKPVIENKTLPFMQRRYMNMPAPIAAGLALITITSVAFATVAIIKHTRKSKA